MSEPDPEALLNAPLARAVLAELIGLDPADLPARAGAPEVVAAAVARADLGRLAGCRDPLPLLAAVARVAAGEQASAEAQLAEARDALRPVARALAAAPAARWWWEPPDRARQRWVGLAGATLPRGGDVTGAVRRAIEEDQQSAPAPRRRFLRRGRDVPRSGHWWSAPLGGTVFTTTGPVGGLPAVELAVSEDNAGDETFEVWAVGIGPGARVREIGGPADWAGLTAEYPLDVTASRHDDWDRWTGRAGPWTLPAWPAVSRDWDGIHLTVTGYLLASGEATAAGDAWTLLAGWEADRTLWLNDVFTSVEYVTSWHGSPGSAAMPDIPLPWLGRLRLT
jgi:hypothetical protein